LTRFSGFAREDRVGLAMGMAASDTAGEVQGMTTQTTRRGFLAVAGMAATTAGITAAVPALASAVHHKAAHHHPPAHPLHGHHAQPAHVHVPGHNKLHATPRVAQRAVNMFNIHTNESIQITYWQQGNYQPAALHHISHFMRDFRDHTSHRMDPKLLDLLHDLHVALGSTSEPFHLISGYRSPRTNAWLARHSGGVAGNSFHMRGQASDIQVPGRSLDTLHNTAMALARGGVGYYPRSDFVHVDTGRVRHWEWG
jgi:uncharacterized protein YcbK (DUF882 family)